MDNPLEAASPIQLSGEADFTHEEGADVDAQTPIRPASDWILRQREEVRGILARWLIYILAGAVAASFLLIFILVLGLTDNPDEQAVKDLLPIVFSPLIALVGTALGFYFGSQQ